MQERGNEFLITARNRKHVFDLLKAYNFDYIDRGTGSSNILGKIFYLPKADALIYKIARKFKPDLFLSFGSMYAAHASKLIRKPHIAFEDTDHKKIEYILYAPFTDVICTPSCFKKDFGKKHVRFNGYMELSYLHPNYFKPNPKVLDELNISKDDKFFILRFVSWEASHDFGHKGLTTESKKELIKLLSKYGKVFISSEKDLPREFEKYKINISPEKIHHVLYYATEYIGEGGTMASECAVLGTPTIYMNDLHLGYIDEEQIKYDLIFQSNKEEQIIKKIIELQNNKNLKKEWESKRNKLLNDKIDVTKWMINFIDNYFSKRQVCQE